MIESDYIRVFAPATVSNVACGFDSIGFAINNPGDEIEMWKTERKGVEIIEIKDDNGKLPLDPEKNTAGVSALSFLKKANVNNGIKLKIHKKMPFCCGLGSSAASAVGAVFAANCLFGNILDKNELLNCAIDGEKIASGDVHADNVAPSLFGGFILIRSNDPFDIIDIPYPKELCVAVVTPNIEISTEMARKILKKNVPLKKAIAQWANVGALIAGLMKNDTHLISRSLVDHIIEPQRKHLIPGFDEVKEIAVKEGALGCSISGSGPSIFALSDNFDKCETIGSKMVKCFSKIGIESKLYCSNVNSQGPKILNRG